MPWGEKFVYPLSKAVLGREPIPVLQIKGVTKSVRPVEPVAWWRARLLGPNIVVAKMMSQSVMAVKSPGADAASIPIRDIR